MKIQPTSNNAPTSKKKSIQGKSSESFDAIFATHASTDQEVKTVVEHNIHHEPPQNEFRDIAHTLNHLEDMVMKLDEDPGNHQQAVDAISDLRSALQHASTQSGLSEADIQNADVMLAVEAKRLEALKK